MSPPIVNPPVPYVGTVPDGLEKGKMIRIQGVASQSADRFNINLQTGPVDKPRDDVALHISVRLNQGYIARNTYIDGSWGDEQGTGRLPIGHGQRFEIIILCDANDFKIAVNGQHFCEFPQKLSLDRITHLLIDGDLFITLISFESSVPSAPQPGGDDVAARASSLHSSGPADGYGAPPGAGYGPPPHQGYGPPSQQGYGPPSQQGYGPPQQGYGPPPQGYGPPPQQGYGPPPPGYGPPLPPGGQPESGFDNFLESAQSVLASAIASGAAEKLLGNILHPGQNQSQTGYAPQNAQYGQYPHPSQQYQQQHQQQGDFRLPQVGGEGSIGGLGSVGSLLSSLAGQVFRAPREPGRQQYH